MNSIESAHDDKLSDFVPDESCSLCLEMRQDVTLPMSENAPNTLLLTWDAAFVRRRQVKTNLACGCGA